MWPLIPAVGLLLVILAGQVAAVPDLENAVRMWMAKGRHGGMVAGVLTGDGKMASAGIGNSGSESVTLDSRTIFEIGSITKVFTTTLLAEMVERGEVQFEDPVAKYLPSSVSVPERNGRRITLVDLATHTSGLPRLMTNLRPANLRNPYADYSVEQLYAFLSGHQLTRDVGAQYEYSNVGMGLLGHALARRAGESYEALVTERILEPLGMKDTAITLTADMSQRLALGFALNGSRAPNWDIPTLAGAGALRATVHDMLLFARANLSPSDGRLSRAMNRTHQVRGPTGRPGLSIALGWHVRQTDGSEVHWHNGGTGGYRTWMGFDLRRKVAAVVLTNSAEGADDFGLSLVTGK
jgi:CubicO group peptidase (beta-lactamase class C family)